MKLIDNKKIPSGVMIALLGLSFGLAEWFTSRGVVANLSIELGYSMPYLYNDIIAIVTGALFPILFYEVITTFAFRINVARFGATAVGQMRYALRYFYFVANLVIFALNFIFFAEPIASVWGTVVIKTLVLSVFIVLYMWYCAKRYLTNTTWGAMCYQVGGMFVIIYGVLAVLQIVVGVFLV